MNEDKSIDIYSNKTKNSLINDKPNKNIRELNKVQFLDKIASIIKVLLNQNYSSEISIRSPKFFHFFSQKNIEKKIYVN